MLQFLNLIKESPLVPIRKSTYWLNTGDEQIKGCTNSGMKELWGHSWGVGQDWMWLFYTRSVDLISHSGAAGGPSGAAVGGWRRHHSPDAFLGGDPCQGERATKPVPVPSARVLVGSSDPFPHQHSVWPPPAAAAPLCALQYPIAATMETAGDGGLQKNLLIKTCLKL